MSPAVRPTAAARVVTDRVRAICEGLPHTVERLSHGEATWFIDDKRSFASMSDHHHDERISVVFAGAEGVQASLVASEPGRYYRPPYVGGRGWIGAYLDVPAPDWDAIEHMLISAWRLIAPARLHGELDG